MVIQHHSQSLRSMATSELGMVARLFKGSGSAGMTALAKARFVLALGMLLLALLGAWRAVVDVTPASGAPKVFHESRNLGRLQVLREEVFSMYDEDDLDSATDVFSSTKPVVQKTCPGLVPGSNNVYCTGSSQGTCNDATKLCTCICIHMHA